MFKQFITLTYLLFSLSTILLAQKAAPVVWEEAIQSLGKVSVGDSYTVIFKFTNIGNTDVIVDNVRTNCRCIVPYWENKVVPPNTKGKVTLTYTVDKSGIFNKGVLVTFKNYKTAEIIQIEATTDNIEEGLITKKTTEKIVETPQLDLPKINTETATPPGLADKEKISTMVPGQPNRKKTTPNENEKITPVYESDISNRKPDADFPYMTIREREMIDEINLLRSNPKEYVPFVQAYIQSMEKEIQNDPSMATMYLDEISTAYELVKALNATDPLSILKPHEGVYAAAKLHGDDMLKNTKFSHVGSDGSYPWDRIAKAAPDLSDGNENLVGGPYEIRQAVILLLVDSGIPDRGHRKTLLNPGWNFVACRELGQIGKMPNCWIQNFAKK
jgi:uncharacterized protein YkwD